MFDIILNSLPNVYSDDFIKKEVPIFFIGTKNLNVTVSFGACVQTKMHIERSIHVYFFLDNSM